MNESQKYNAALTLELLGWSKAVNYVRNCIGGCFDTAVAIIDGIAEENGISAAA
jgi:hypothetical protein